MKHTVFETIEFSLPVQINRDYVLKVNDGGNVKKGDLLALKRELKTEVIDLDTKLKVKDKKHITVRVAEGDKLIKGSVLAEKQMFMSRLKVLAPYDLVVNEITNNVIRISQQEDEMELLAPMSGVITSGEEGQILISADALQYRFEYAAGNATWGELKLCYGHSSESDWMDISLESKVILIEELTPVIWHKANALGVKGIIAGIASSTFEQWIDVIRDNAGVLIHNGNHENWELLVESIESYQGKMIFVVPQEKLMVITK